MWTTVCPAETYCAAGTCRNRLTQWNAGGSRANAITRGADGNLWFLGGRQVGKINLSGAVTLYNDLIDWTITQPGETILAVTGAITAGPDGNVWYLLQSDRGVGYVNRITATGQVSSWIYTTTNPSPNSIVAAPDGNLWFSERYANIISPPDRDSSCAPPPARSRPRRSPLPGVDRAAHQRSRRQPLVHRVG